MAWGGAYSSGLRVLSLDARLRITSDEHRFSSTVSLFDYDIVFWHPARTLDSLLYRFQGFQGQRCLDRDESARVRKVLDRRATEFREFLELGRTLVVFLPGDSVVSAYTGEKEHSGTGRNRQTTEFVEDLDILDCLSVATTGLMVAGLDIEAADGTISALYRETADFWVYRRVLDSTSGLNPLMRVKGTDKVVAAYAENPGMTILMPWYWRPSDEPGDDGNRDELDHSDEPADTEAAQSVDEDDPEKLEASADEALLAWLASFTRRSAVHWPDWADRYAFPTQAARDEKIEKARSLVAKHQATVDTLQAEQETETAWKLLVAGTGEPLENQVREALTVLGFELKPAVRGRADIRASYAGKAVVVEVKGVAKSAAEKHAAQLEKWVAEEKAGGDAVKGILIVNGWKDIAPDRRNQAVFPDQMIGYSTAREHCLVTGVQLLAMVRTALQNPTRAPNIAQELLATAGPVAGWGDSTLVETAAQSG